MQLVSTELITPPESNQWLVEFSEEYPTSFQKTLREFVVLQKKAHFSSVI